MSDQAYARLQKEAHTPSIGYWVSVISIAIAAITLGTVRMRLPGITTESISFLLAGILLSTLIIARIMRDIKERL